MSENNGEQKRQSNDEGRSVVEWITLGISVAILLVVAGLIVYEALTDNELPTVIVVQPDFEGVRQEVGHYYLPVTIRNRGNRTVMGLAVEMRLEGEDGEVETGVLTEEFMAGGARVEGVVVFNERPTTENVGYGVSYRKP